MSQTGFALREMTAHRKLRAAKKDKTTATMIDGDDTHNTTINPILLASHNPDKAPQYEFQNTIVGEDSWIFIVRSPTAKCSHSSPYLVHPRIGFDLPKTTDGFDRIESIVSFGLNHS
jgi:hypothetical protein